MTRSRGHAARMVGVCLGSFLLVMGYLHGGLSPAFDQLRPIQTGKKREQVALGHWSYNFTEAVVTDAQQQLQQQRRALLDQACAAQAGPRRLLAPADLRHLVVDDRHRLLYCYVPKVACTNWKRVLMVLAGQAAEPLAIPARRAHLPASLPTLDAYPPAEINRRLRHYLKFVFVREPFERLVSAYLNKFTRAYNAAFHRRYGTRIVRRHRARPSARALRLGADVSFSEFAWYLADPRTRRDGPFNEHWAPAHSLCHPCLIRYDVLGRYETLAADARYLLALVGAERPVAFPAGSRRATTAGVAAAFFRNISAFYRQKLYQIYRLDFELFNYSVPAYLGGG